MGWFLYQFSGIGVLPVRSLALRSNFAVKLFWSLTPGLVPVGRDVPPSFELYLLSVSVLRDATLVLIPVQWHSCGAG